MNLLKELRGLVNDDQAIKVGIVVSVTGDKIQVSHNGRIVSLSRSGTLVAKDDRVMFSQGRLIQVMPPIKSYPV